MKWIDDCFGSLRKSSVPTEVIVIDNNSTDETVSYLRKNYPEVHVIEAGKNLGFGKANNEGVSLGLKNGSDYFFLLNQDAWIYPDTLQNLIENFEKHPEFGIISPVQITKDLEVENIFKSYLKKVPQLLKKFNPNKKYNNSVHKIDFANAAMWMIPKKCIEKVGGFSPVFYHYGEDVDYVNRTKFHGFEIGVSENAYGIHDRAVKPKKTTAELNKQKKHPGPWPLKYYMILSNPNFSFGNAIMKCSRLFFVSLAKHLLKLNFFSVKYDFIVIKDVLKKVNFVRSTRKITEKEQPSFLN